MPKIRLICNILDYSHFFSCKCYNGGGDDDDDDDDDVDDDDDYNSNIEAFLSCIHSNLTIGVVHLRS